MFLIFLLCYCEAKEKTVAIQPFEKISPELIDSISAAIKNVYGYNTIVLGAIDYPKNSFINVKSPRHRADSIIKFLKIELPKDANYILGVCEKDISTTKKDAKGNALKPSSKYYDWGIFGLGYRPGISCVVSSFRTEKFSPKFYERMQKISVHEIGHNLGLPHCNYSKFCVMNDAAETIKTVDRVNLSLCENCKKKLN
jgi:archaemetzincin